MSEPLSSFTLDVAEVARQLVLAPALDPAQVRAWFVALGFEEPDQADRRFQQLAGRPPAREIFADLAPDLLRYLRDCPAPDAALNNLGRFVERGDPLTTYHFWRDDPWVLELLVTLLSTSQLLADLLIRNPEYLSPLLEPGTLEREKDAAEMTAELARRVRPFHTLEAQQNALRRYKRQEFLRIGARDLLGYADLKTITRELSALAEAELRIALECVARDLQARQAETGKLGCEAGETGKLGNWAAKQGKLGCEAGETGKLGNLAQFPNCLISQFPNFPISQLPSFAIIGMGKFGAQELNYNSDIDVMFVYETREAEPPKDGTGFSDPSSLIPHPSSFIREYCDQLARGVLRAIGEMTAEGRVFRVDARLRPEGERGPLARSLDSYMDYYEAWSEPWESQALLKARAVAGDADLGRRFESLAQEVAYGRQLDLAAITSIRENKRRLEERADREGRGNTQVKQGYGGIRDVEFTVQLLQLVHGLTDPRVRVANTFEALAALAAAGYLTETEREVLEQSYIFLRRVEHQLQIQQEVPRQTLPDKPSELRALAKRMGYYDGAWTPATERFLDAYRWHTEQVRAICERLFFHPLPSGYAAVSQEVQLLLDPLVKHEEGAAPLRRLGFRDPVEARRQLIFLAYGEPPMRLPERVQQVFVEILPNLLAGVAATPDPDAAIRNFERFISKAGGRETFYEFLRDQPRITELLCRIGGFSGPLSRTLIDHPEYLDTITDRSVMAEPKDQTAFRAELAERLKGLRKKDLQLADLRRYKRREMFRIGVRDLTHAADLETTMAEISDLADVCVEAALAICQAPPSEVPKVPKVPKVTDIGHSAPLPDCPVAQLPLPSPSLRFAVLGLGKLGGRELHYHSDLDVLFVYAPPEGADSPPCEGGAGGVNGRAAAFQAAERLAEELLQAIGERTRHGVVFEIDARLRPFGKEGQLARTVESYRDYYAQRGETWERLALTRARFVAGDEALGEELLTVLRAAAFESGLSAADRAAIQHVKRRIETERLQAGPEAIDLKLTPGGVLDVEFLVQVLQLEHGRNRPEVCTPNTSAALLALGDAGLLAADDAAFLGESYRRLRRLELRLELVSERASAVLPEDEASLAAAARRLEYRGDSDAEIAARLRADYEATLSGVRAVYERVVGVAG